MTARGRMALTSEDLGGRGLLFGGEAERGLQHSLEVVRIEPEEVLVRERADLAHRSRAEDFFQDSHLVGVFPRLAFAERIEALVQRGGRGSSLSRVMRLRIRLRRRGGGSGVRRRGFGVVILL